MSLQTFFDNFALLAEAPNAVQRLRDLILQLAIEGKLVSQDSNDEPADVLLDKIKAKQARLVKERVMKQIEVQPLAAVNSLPFILPEGWQWTRLGSISQKLGAGSTPLGGKNVYQSSGVRFLRSQNVWNDGLQLDRVAYISENIHQDMSGTQVEAADILLNITGASIGRSSIVPADLGEANVSQHVSIVRLIDKQLRFFVHLCIISPYVQDSIMQTQVGISREGLSMRSLKEFVLPIPPLEEQKRIVAKVDELMRLCDELETRQQAKRESRVRLNNVTLAPLNKAALLVPEEVEQASVRLADNFAALSDSAETVGKLRATILQLAVQGKLVPQDPRDEPASKLLERLKKDKSKLVKGKKSRKTESDLPLNQESMPFTLPSGWLWSRLVELGVTQTGTTPPTLRAEYFGNDYPFIKPGDMTNNGINYERDGLSNLGLEVGRLVPANSVLMVSIGGSIGKVGIVDRECSCNQQINYITLQNGVIPKLLYYYLKTPYFQEQVLSLAPKTTLPILSKGKWDLIPVPLPPVEEQKRIVTKVNQLMTLCDELETKLRQAEADSEKLMNAAVQHLLTSISERSAEILAGASA
jgi:type I restriction enzyme S subunit